MNVQPAILCDNVVKHFYFYEHRTTSIREWFIRAVQRKPIHIRRPQFSLQDFNLRVNRGEAVGLVGSNGCGKSTALRLIAGIYSPTSGTVETIGRLAAVIELGAGFHADLTGAENVELYAAVMGMTRSQLAGRRKEIVQFAGIEGFMDMPIKYYSSGMQARLAFAVAVCVAPDILLLDEVLAVGDRTFQDRCLVRLRDFQARGGTMVVVSHDLNMLRTFCSRAVWLERGEIRLEGKIDRVLEAYTKEIG